MTLAAVAAFVGVHGWLFFAGTYLAPGIGFNDLNWYRIWVSSGLSGHGWPVVDKPWVYPVLALVPMLIPAAVPAPGYVAAWCAMVLTLDLVAGALLLRRRGGVRAIWWWSAFLALLGPVAIARLDAVVAPLAVVALLFALDRPAVASLLLTVGAWVKVAPAALLLPLLAVSRRWVRVVLPPIAMSLAVLVFTLGLGSGKRSISFLVEQGARGLQIEAPAGTPWLIDSLVSSKSAPWPNSELNTWEVVGPGTQVMANLLGVLLPAALLLVGGLVFVRRKTLGPSLWHSTSRRAELLALGALLAVVTTLVFNKVGSPQFMCWLAAPVLVALGLELAGWRVMEVLVLLTAATTQMFFPWFYSDIPAGRVPAVLVLCVRNALVVSLWVLALVRLVRTAPDPRGTVYSQPLPTPDSAVAVGNVTTPLLAQSAPTQPRS